MNFSKHDLTEDDVRSKFITPALQKKGWNLYSLEGLGLVRENFLVTKGKLVIEGNVTNREPEGRADYVLFYKSNIPIAVIEAKNFNFSSDKGIQQALNYSNHLDVPFVFSSNGEEFVFFDKTNKKNVQKKISLESFPTPKELWEKFVNWKNFSENRSKLYSEDYYFDPSGKVPRPYQLVAINRIVEAIVNKQNRILLVMATGTGKTYTAFNIIWRLWKSGLKKRILFLTDRNFLIDQAKIKDFKPFGNAMTKVVKRKVDKAYEIYLSLYQGLTGPIEKQKIYKKFSKNFFDLIVVDECHRGSVNEDSEWRDILNYFSEATQIGMTATPKETKYKSNISYFGKPVFQYTLKDGIEDGYSAPCRILEIDFDKDKQWIPNEYQKDTKGNNLKIKKYNFKDYDRNIIIKNRREKVAERITEYLKETDRFQKTIVFCEDIEHAAEMRNLLTNLNSDITSKNHTYVMKITGDDNIGKRQIDNFINPKSKFPVIATTSRLLTTGADVETCKLIVIDKIISSLSEFKQIIGRGTRVNEDYGKFYYTIIDFRKACKHFYDPNFDGKPVKILDDNLKHIKKIKKIIKDSIKIEKQIIDNVDFNIDSERIIKFNKKNSLTTESIKSFVKDKVTKNYKTLNNFINIWNESEKKTVVINELKKEGILFEELYKYIGKEYDAFDLICHIAFDQEIKKRIDRANMVKNKKYLEKYSKPIQSVLNAILDKYSDQGIENIENIEVLKLPPIDKFGSVHEIISIFGGRNMFENSIKELSRNLYR
jgi:type I restriction enzyme, R subunit